jgi:LysR family glycine cleavage system transcriptional activator
VASTRYPVISPDLLRRGPALKTPEDLRHFTLLHEDCPNFEKWFDHIGVSVANARRGVTYASYDHVLQAAIAGQGIALGFDIIVAEDINAGRLVRLFDVEYPNRILYSLVTPRPWAERPRNAAFRAWLLEETGALSESKTLMDICAGNDLSVHVRP